MNNYISKLYVDVFIYPSLNTCKHNDGWSISAKMPQASATQQQVLISKEIVFPLSQMYAKCFLT